MTEFVFFLGRFHVLALHLPIGILLLVIVMQGIAQGPRFNYLQPAIPLLWLAGAVTALIAVIFGIMHATEGGFSDAALAAHRNSALLLMLLAFAIWLIRVKWQRFYQRSWLIFSIGILALLFLTGHYGGNLTHGDTYLVEYAPRPVQALLGVPAESLSRPRPTDLASADIYLDVIAPALKQRCGNCHNDSKRKGGLSLAQYSSLMEGGENGAVIVAGQPGQSDLVRRITLNANDEDFMPTDGKTPLSKAHTQVISWWVGQGAPASGSPAELQLDGDIESVLKDLLGLDGHASNGQTSVSQTLFPAGLGTADPESIAELENSGFAIRPIATNNPLLDVDFTAQREITDADLSLLAQLKHQVYSLTVRNAGLTDEHLRTIAQFENLRHLRIELNPISNSGLRHLAPLDQLEILNIYGTSIDDEGLGNLEPLKNLHTLYIWQTNITEEGIAHFSNTHPLVEFDSGVNRAELPPSPESVPIIN